VPRANGRDRSAPVHLVAAIGSVRHVALAADAP